MMGDRLAGAIEGVEQKNHTRYQDLCGRHVFITGGPSMGMLACAFVRSKARAAHRDRIDTAVGNS